MQKYVIAVLLLAVLVLVFALMNNTIIPVNLGFTGFQIALPWLIAITLASGMALSYLMSLGRSFRKRAQINELRREISGLKQQLIDLRPVEPVVQKDLNESPLQK